VIVKFKQFESDSGKYYRNVSSGEIRYMTNVFVNQMNKRPEIAVDFTKREKEKLLEILGKALDDKKIHEFRFNPRFPYILNILGNYPSSRNIDPILAEVTVWKVEDDYFWVKFRPYRGEEAGYVCDQFDGLIRLLSDLGF